MLLASVITVATLALSISIQLPADVESMLRWGDTAVCGIFFFRFPAIASPGQKQKEIPLYLGLDRPHIVDSPHTGVTTGEVSSDPQNLAPIEGSEIGSHAAPGTNPEQTPNGHVCHPFVNRNNSELFKYRDSDC